MIAVYVAGPYGAPTPEGVAANVMRAASVAAELLYQHGYAVYCPHSMSHGFERAQGYTWDRTLESCCEWVQRSDAVLLLPGWQASPGSLLEREVAIAAGVPIFCSVRDLLQAFPARPTQYPISEE